MRNNEYDLIQEFKNDLKPYMETAVDFCSSHEDKRGHRYPRVYYAKNKNGKYGVTLPGIPELGITHSANDCPIGLNSVVYATAWAMLIEDLSSKSSMLYLEWCQKYNYLNRHNRDSFTGIEYVRVVPNTREDSPLYALYIPETGRGYHLIYKDAKMGERYYESIKEAIFYRNRELYNLVKRGKDAYGELSVTRKNAYCRILTKGYFQAIILSSVPEKNCGKFMNAFHNAAQITTDEKLQKCFSYFRNLLAGRVNNIYDVSLYVEYRDILDMYLHTIEIEESVEKSIKDLISIIFTKKINENLKSYKKYQKKYVS